VFASQGLFAFFDGSGLNLLIGRLKYLEKYVEVHDQLDDDAVTLLSRVGCANDDDYSCLEDNNNL